MHRGLWRSKSVLFELRIQKLRPTQVRTCYLITGVTSFKKRTSTSEIKPKLTRSVVSVQYSILFAKSVDRHGVLLFYLWIEEGEG